MAEQDEKNINSFLDPILGKMDYKEFNQRSCLNGFPLKTFKNFLKDFSFNKITSGQFQNSARIVFNIYQAELGVSLDTAIKNTQKTFEKSNSKIDADEFEKIAIPLKWNKNLTRKKLINQSNILIRILEETIEIAKKDKSPKG